MKIINTGLKEWENKHEIFKEQISSLSIAGNEPAFGTLESYNDCTKAFQNQIAEAIKNSAPYRSLGSGWAFSKIATATDGIMMDTKQLNTTIYSTAQSIVPEYAGDSSKLVFAQCGNALWELSKELRTKKLSLKTCGASNGQTIVGAMAGGTHGSAFDFGAVPDYIVGLHIIVSPTRHIWLERKTYPVAANFFIKNLGTELVQDDELFNSALVSFGSFGIIHGVMVETEDLFLLETYMRRMPYDDTLKKLMGTLDFSNAELPCGNERPFHFAVSINPYDLENGAYVSSFYKRPFHEDYIRAVPNEAGIGPGDDAPCFVGKLTNLIPALVPTVVTKLLAGAFTPFEKKMGTLGEIFDNTTLRGKLFSAAIGISLEHVSRVTGILLEINKTDGPFTGFFTYRFVKKSKAKLAFTRFDFTCVIELDAAPSNNTADFYTIVWKRLEDEQIPFTFHWGKLNEMDFDRISRMYGQDATDWITARNKLLADADSLKVFTNPLLQQWGLDKVL